MIKKRWIILFVENEIGVLASISGLFSGKSYNLDSLTAGVTEDKSISRMTISLTSDERTFEQIKKQLNRSVEVIKVIDFTDTAVHMRELMFIRIFSCAGRDFQEIFRLAHVFDVKIIDYGIDSVLIQSVQTESQNNDMISLFEKFFSSRIEIVRGGSVATEAISISER